MRLTFQDGKEEILVISNKNIVTLGELSSTWGGYKSYGKMKRWDLEAGCTPCQNDNGCKQLNPNYYSEKS
jgi:hypothetical protein